MSPPTMTMDVCPLRPPTSGRREMVLAYFPFETSCASYQIQDIKEL